MNKKSKLISGLSETKKKRRKNFVFSDEQKHDIINDYLTSRMSKRAIWEKHTGDNINYRIITKWMRYFGYGDITKKNNKFVKNYNYMKKDFTPKKSTVNDSFENLQLKKRIAELESKLQKAELKAIAFSTMVDIAESELKINIKKKFNTKP